MNEINNIGNALEVSTVNDRLLEVLTSSADYTLEKLMELGEGIPILSYIFKGAKAHLAIRDYLFMEKVVEFLRTVGEEPTSHRLQMINKIQNDQAYNEKFGKVSMVAIDRYDEVEKARLLGYAAKYLARNEISFPLYKRISFIIGRLYLADLVTFANHNQPLILLNFTADLEALGLVHIYYGMTKGYDSSEREVGYSVRITDLGKAVKCVVSQQPLNGQQSTVRNQIGNFEEILKQRYP